MDDKQQNFANYPRSLAEIRAEKEENGSLWKPRDALIELLRRIDDGAENPYALVIVWATPPTEASAGERVTWSSACPDSIVATGMLSRTIHRMHVCATTEQPIPRSAKRSPPASSSKPQAPGAQHDHHSRPRSPRAS